MSNIYISPMAAPSFESLSAEAQRPATEFSATNGNFKPVQKSDENMNEVFAGVTKSDTVWQSPNDHGKNEELEELQRKVWNKSPNVIMSKTITGSEFETPSGTLTTLRIRTHSQESSSPPRKSPVYCFHSFTYGVGESVEGEVDESGPSAQTSSTWEDQSYDGDSPNVWHTRTVVESEEDNGSPTFRCAWKWEIETETGIAASSYELKEDVSSTSGKIKTHGKTPQISDQEENENSAEYSCTKNKIKMTIRRLSPEGAEYNAAGDGDTESYLMVPDKLVVAEAQRRDTLGNNLGRSPSGRIAEDGKDYWTSQDSSGGKTVEDGKCQDRVPLLHTGKRHVRYTPEEGFEEMEDGVPVTCCSCDHCVIL